MRPLTYFLAAAVAFASGYFFDTALVFAQAVQLHGTIPARAQTMTPLRALDSSRPLSLDIHLPLRKRAELNRLLAEQIDRSSPNYHQWLSSAEFERRFGATPDDYQAVESWLTGKGFLIVNSGAVLNDIRFSGTVAQAEEAFAVELKDFGAGKYASTIEPTIPADLADKIADIGGLDNFATLAPDFDRRTAKLLPTPSRDRHPKAGSGPDFNLADIGKSGFTFADVDFYTFYNETPLLNDGMTGNNGSDCIGIFADTNIFPEPSQATILKDYFAEFAMFTGFSTDPAITIDLTEKDPGVVADFDGEAYLDIEWSHVAAPGAPITLYVANPNTESFNQNLTDAIGAMTKQNACGALTFSYHTCDESSKFLTTTLGDLFSQAQAQGQSAFGSAGDKGADLCQTGSPNINELTANPFITSVGGTQSTAVTYNAQGFVNGYATEVLWNDQNGDSSFAGESTVGGGGPSAVFTKPTWQMGLAGASDDNFRDTPDVALLAGLPRVIIYLDEDLGNTATPTEEHELSGGTSLSAPAFAGLSRVLEQANGGHRLGSLNPIIYELGNAGQSANGLNDITSGNNTFISVVNGKDVTVQGFSAGSGYDLVSGWGTVDFNQFVTSYLAAPAPPVDVDLVFVPPSLNFGKVTVNSASKAHKLVIENKGKKGGPSVILNGFTPSSNMAIASGTCANGTILEVNKTCFLELTFTPAATGANSGDIAIMSNALNNGAMVPASATGTEPKTKK